MKFIGMAAALALVVATGAVPAAADKDVRLVGCVVKADNGYVLTNVKAVTDAPETAGATGTANPAQAPTSAVLSRTFYWLEEDDDLKDHVGHRVEVAGELEDVDRGQISVEREGGMIELEFKVEGDKKVTVKVPDTPAAAATAPVGTSGVTDRERDLDVVVKKLDVKSVKMIASTCS
jgi:hypothetical protein